jgi:hypothetical protein
MSTDHRRPCASIAADSSALVEKPDLTPSSMTTGRR